MNPIVVWVSDLHINGTTSLCVPQFEKDDGEIHVNNRLQNVLWDAWRDGWKDVKKRAKGREIVTIIGGEIADEMKKHPSLQYITQNPDDIRRLSLDTLEPCLNVTDKMIVLRGTEAHSGYSANLDEGIAREIAKTYDIEFVKDGNRFSHWYLKIYIGGRLFDLAHHVGMGTGRRTERDAANHLSADLQMDYIRKWADNKHRRFELPDFALRGHVHRYSESGDNWPIKSIIGPAWMVGGVHAHRIGAGASKADIGFVVIEPDTKKTEWIKYVTEDKEIKHI